MNYRLLLFTLLFSGATSLFAQQGTLNGTVLDATSKQAINGATIFLRSNKSFGTTTDGKGNFSLTLPVGNQIIICNYLGYKSDTFTVVIEDGKIATYNVLLA